MTPPKEEFSELDIIDDYVREQNFVEGLKVVPSDVAILDSVAFLSKPQASRKVFNPHFLNKACLENDPGPFQFEVCVAESVNQRRSKPYVFSPELCRLYSVSAEPVAFVVSTSRDLPAGCLLYAFPIYSDAMYRPENVVTCAYHTITDVAVEHPNSGKGFLRAGNGLNVNYLTLGAPARDVLQFSLLASPVNEVIPLKFMCRNSCQGGINRRATKLVLVLCNRSNDTLGVSVIDFKVVSIPSRDSKRDAERISGVSPKIKVMSSKKARSEPEGASSDSEEYVIRIRGAKNFRLLKTAAEGLELRRKVRKLEKNKHSEGIENSSLTDLIFSTN